MNWGSKKEPGYNPLSVDERVITADEYLVKCYFDFCLTLECKFFSITFFKIMNAFV